MSATLTVNVKDAMTRLPIGKVEVSVFKNEMEIVVTKTDPTQGNMNVDIDSPHVGQTLTCKVFKAGYERNEESFVVSDGENILNIDIRPKSVKFAVSVKDEETQKPLSGAEIDISIEGKKIASGKTEANSGSVNLKIASQYAGKTLTCKVIKNGYVQQEQTCDVSIGENVLNIDIKQSRTPWKIIAAVAVILIMVISIALWLVHPSQPRPKPEIRPKKTMVKVPSVINKKFDDVKENLQSDFKLDIIKQAVDKRSLVNKIIAQNPSSGSAQKGSILRLTVGHGVIMPNIQGRLIEEALEMMRASELRFEVHSAQPPTPIFTNLRMVEIVDATSQQGGSIITNNTTVMIYTAYRYQRPPLPQTPGVMP